MLIVRGAEAATCAVMSSVSIAMTLTVLIVVSATIAMLIERADDRGTDCSSCNAFAKVPRSVGHVVPRGYGYGAQNTDDRDRSHRRLVTRIDACRRRRREL